METEKSSQDVSSERNVVSTGSENEANIPEETESPPQNLPKSTPRSKSFGKLNLEVHDVKVDEVPQMPEIQENEEAGEALSDFNEQDAQLLAQAIWNVPGAMFGDYLAPDPKLVDRWGTQLFRYCERKGINMWDYAFDELPLLMSSMMLGGSMVKKYSEHKKELEIEKKLKEKEEDVSPK